ncbi:MAG: alanine--tRNA ligase [Candidatus Methanospirare jalkutatii]|nr:alanine--tRNA ligase [Candidatus Methanospirare jalkutatii]
MSEETGKRKDTEREKDCEGEMSEEAYEIPFFSEEGFVRKRCERCNAFFWTKDEGRKTCGDAPCEPYKFISNPVFREKSVDEMREAFLSFFERHSHKRLKRYPVVARWRDDIYLTIASIANFQPFVTSGRVPPPANPLVISQPCIRLEDLESIGRTGRHLTIFEMMGHHAFNKRDAEIYWKDETVRYCAEFLRELGADIHQVTFKEAPWIGGGNAGPCLEVILGGLEVATLVFMDLERSPDGEIVLEGERYRKMETYIVDTGYGLERFVWASKGTPTVYDAVFPEVVSELLSYAGFEHPQEKYPEETLRCASLLGVLKLEEAVKRLHLSEDFLRDFERMSLIYALADHTKCLAFMLADGVVPSNAKEGYLARLVIRRAFRMKNALRIETPLEEIVISHIRHLRRTFPELEHAIDRISEMLALEKKRFEETLSRGAGIVKRIVAECEKRGARKIPTETLIQLYDTHGLPPEFVKDVVEAHSKAVSSESGGGVQVEVEIPEDFYSQVAKMHSTERGGEEGEEGKGVESEEILRRRVSVLPKTAKLFYEKPTQKEFQARVLDAFDRFVVLDRTLFYPEGGGQPADTGVLIVSGEKKGADAATAVRVLDVQDVEGVVLHDVGEEASKFNVGDEVRGVVDWERRMALTRHHTATHIVLFAARKVLGEHIWQAGAQKGEKRSRIDVTHFKRISAEERRRIELLANEIVMRNLPVHASFVARNEAERKYGFRIYQGGVPDGAEIRIVSITDEEGVLDVQACAGTHCSRTGDVGCIKILSTRGIQDGIERIEFAAGIAAVEEMQSASELLQRAASVLRVPPSLLPATVERFFDEWKALRKENERLKAELAEMQINSLREKAFPAGDVRVIAEILRGLSAKELLKIATTLSKEGFVAVLIGTETESRRASVVAAVPKALTEKIAANSLTAEICKTLGGGGGGSAEIAQGGGFNVERAKEAVALAKEAVLKALNEGCEKQGGKGKYL